MFFFHRFIKVESNPSYCKCYFMRLIIHLSGDPGQQLVTIFCPGDTLWCPHKMINFSNDPEENNFQWFRSDHRHFGQIVDTVESKISLSGLMVWSKIGHREDLCWMLESINELRFTWPSARWWRPRVCKCCIIFILPPAYTHSSILAPSCRVHNSQLHNACQWKTLKVALWEIGQQPSQQLCSLCQYQLCGS